jgi:hypothetical protein
MRPVPIDIVQKDLGRILARELLAPMCDAGARVENGIPSFQGDFNGLALDVHAEGPWLIRVVTQTERHTDLTSGPILVLRQSITLLVDAEVGEGWIKGDSGCSLHSGHQVFEESLHARIGVHCGRTGHLNIALPAS